MEIHKASPLFVVDNDDRIKFIYTKVLFSQNGKFFSGHSSKRHVGSEIHRDELKDVQDIPEDVYSPLIPPGSTIAPVLQDNPRYLKRVDLFSLEVSSNLPNPVLQELAACERIKQHPHPNIATYYGCQAVNGRITGLFFEKYLSTLLDQANPGALNKTMFLTDTDRTFTQQLADRYLPGIEAGIRHLHALGLVHNDLNPGNIMVADDGRPVIIDFDSCRSVGADLSKVKRTNQWFKRDNNVSVEANDLDALEEIRVWLTGSTPADYKFGGL